MIKFFKGEYMLNYSFFDYKYNITDFTSDMFGVSHIIYIVLAFISVFALGFFLRNTKHKKIDIFLKVISIFSLVFEVVKITWESYFDITTGRGFNAGGILPLYTCSLFIYTTLIAGWGKGKAKEVSLSWLGTIGMVSGAIGVVYTNGLNYYPFWTFGGFYSLYFHYIMFFTGMFILTTRYKRLEWKDVFISWIPMVLLSVIASPVNYYYGGDYMQIKDGSGIPLMSTLADKLNKMKLQPLFTIIMLCTYILISVVVIGGYKIIEKICQRKNGLAKT